MFADLKALEGRRACEVEQGTDKVCPIPSDNLPAWFPSIHGRHPGTRRVNTDYSLFSFRHQMIQKISQLSSHHNLLEDKLHVINLPLHFV